jgi:uncharacterized membrane protein YkvA (DUF1232 family)
MSEEKKPNRITKIEKDNPGFLTGMSRTLMLVLRLLGDRRVSFWLKLLPIGTLIYLISPLDAAIPLIDDAMLIGLGTYAFIELSPQNVVEEHRARLAGMKEDISPADNPDSVVDSTFKDSQD